MKKMFFSFLMMVAFSATALASSHEETAKSYIRDEIIGLIGKERFNDMPVVRLQTCCDYITDATPRKVALRFSEKSPYWMSTGQDVSKRLYFAFVLINPTSDILKTLVVHERYSLPEEHAEHRGTTGMWAVGNHDLIGAPIFFNASGSGNGMGVSYKDEVFNLLGKLLAGETVKDYRLFKETDLSSLVQVSLETKIDKKGD